MRARSLLCLIGTVGLAAGAMSLNPSSAAAAGRQTCSGTFTSPGVLAGTYSASVIVEGFCVVNAGPATVNGDLIVGPGAALVAAFALNDQTGTGSSSLTVMGNLKVQTGGVLLMGCEPFFFTCLDDPDQNNPTLSSADSVGGNLTEAQPLGVVVHDSSIGRNVIETGGGGGVTCQPSGLFAAFGSPVYSDYEDSTVAGNVVVTGLNSCWLGLARDHINGNMIVNDNQLADPDAIEILSNQVSGNLNCHNNREPDGAFHDNVWDSFDTFGQAAPYPRTAAPNTVNGQRTGQCVLASPTSQGGPLGPGAF